MEKHLAIVGMCLFFMFGWEGGSGEEAGMTQKTGTNEDREEVESGGLGAWLAAFCFAPFGR